MLNREKFKTVQIILSLEKRREAASQMDVARATIRREVGEVSLLQGLERPAREQLAKMQQ